MKKTASILLALFFLMSSSHLTFASHYCGNHTFSHELVLSTIGLGCSMDDNTNQSRINECEDTHNCCDTEVIEFSIKDHFQTSESKITFKQPLVVDKIATLVFSLPTITKTVAVYQNYKPPLPNQDISILFQSFLI